VAVGAVLQIPNVALPERRPAAEGGLCQPGPLVFLAKGDAESKVAASPALEAGVADVLLAASAVAAAIPASEVSKAHETARRERLGHEVDGVAGPPVDIGHLDPVLEPVEETGNQGQDDRDQVEVVHRGAVLGHQRPEFRELGMERRRRGGSSR
jgi:hypothetical protein